jgi:membrane protease YdiL (CAAX protease family)
MSVTPKTVSTAKFFILTYILSWSIWIVLMLASNVISEGLSTIVRLFGVLMPAVSAVILTFIVAGNAGVKKLLGRVKIVRVPNSGRWLVAAIAIYPGLLVAAGLIYNLLYPTAAISLMPLDIGTLIANIIFLTIAALGEEIGWRGVALPSLQKKNSPLNSSLILGLLWSVWHLPFWILLGVLAQFGPVYFVMNFIFIIPTTLFITWMFNQTKGSLFYPVLFHLVFNIVNVSVFAVTSSVEAFGIFIVLQFVVAALILPSLKKSKAVEV